MNSVKCNAWGKLFTTNLGLTPKTSGRLASLCMGIFSGVGYWLPPRHFCYLFPGTQCAHIYNIWCASGGSRGDSEANRRTIDHVKFVNYSYLY